MQSLTQISTSKPSNLATRTLKINHVDADTIKNILRLALELGCRDVYLSSDDYIRARIDNRKVLLTDLKLTHNQVQTILTSMCSVSEITRMYQGYPVNNRYMMRGETNQNISRGFRYSFTKHTMARMEGFNAAIRPIPEFAPTIDQVGIGVEIISAVQNVIDEGKGLILFVGATGEGKSSSLAAIIRYLLEKESHLRILEYARPPEFNFENLNIHPTNQIVHHSISETGKGGDLISYELANAVSMRQAADWYAVGEMTERESFNSATTLSNTGHIVSSTVHANDASGSFSRVADMYPPEERDSVVQKMIEEFELIVAQKLLDKAGGGLIAVREVLASDSEIRTRLKSQKSVQSVVDETRAILRERKLDYVSQARKLLEAGLITNETYSKFTRRGAR
ncbi:ATPase, T2SS/T4P/T4SS family [Vibrio fluvialis]|uniref:ATPase, T2SS/T4P/T4SS family n=1 Tax=Vibrio fluvialis TaxID=676 RepID=UPI0023A9D174|nr:ATPase, T2SS/T4P/T4SS family [Vibrio fluvialis]MDE5179019.1 ATPase, T2SS/T4P/T4SS family [Vibrio fluvialis]